ncbi:tRNA uridine-5-carboxymethylaminomethyl(34) synthesis GTPase MnmE [Spiroplasma apis]|uniref:tRNA modification GTPase MnmE n=1 Tax=Spiroplasma apis B31 TaxID=1276258 RepID=V5RJG4_SPIAP|nr:tRNA uridine-5-carboxymethylaminomethyl(34) synthesis GTPase MnmE [Spiroplasma apis]AHB36842.1 tRNA modification GTPase TrmE [Spiroplasma apis B31]
MKNNIYDTIIAPATKIAKQAISIIRMSGEDAFSIMNKLLKTKLSYENKIQLRKIYEENEVIDEAIILTFVENKSFTGENVIEINCHGGVLLSKKIMNLLIKNGARMAKPGEFSQRAFLNGKIDLLQADAINNLIDSRNNLSIKINAKSLEGTNNKMLLDIKEELLDIISRIQTSIDYPDYDDIEGSTIEELTASIQNIKYNIQNLLELSKRVSKISNGIKTGIIGETNVGKSSLLNALINEEKAIVTNIEGTTRDIVEGELNFENFTLNLIDTAGIRNTIDVVEQLGIKKSMDIIEEAELVLYVINNNDLNKSIYEKIKNKDHVIIINKSDLLTNEEANELRKKYENCVLVSAKNKCVDELTSFLKQKFANEDILKTNLPIISNVEHIAMLEIMSNILSYAVDNITHGLPIDMVNLDLSKTLEIINHLLGIIEADEEVIDNIFRKYCLGK